MAPCAIVLPHDILTGGDCTSRTEETHPALNGRPIPAMQIHDALVSERLMSNRRLTVARCISNAHGHHVKPSDPPGIRTNLIMNISRNR